MVSGSRKSGLVAELRVPAHTFLSGLGENQGGHDEGPNPHELLEAALAACTILTAQLYADRKGWPLESTNVKVKILSEGAETLISQEISYTGNLSVEQRSRISEIVNKCPIHRLLESKVKIETKTE
ncbi:MAG: OsmC family protein [Bdellovibrionota bacterium]